MVNHPSDWEIRPPYNSDQGYALFQDFAPVEGEEGFTAARPNFRIEISEDRNAFLARETLNQEFLSE